MRKMRQQKVMPHAWTCPMTELMRQLYSFWNYDCFQSKRLPSKVEKNVILRLWDDSSVLCNKTSICRKQKQVNKSPQTLCTWWFLSQKYSYHWCFTELTPNCLSELTFVLEEHLSECFMLSPTNKFYHCHCCLVTQSCTTHCDPMDNSPPGSSVRDFPRKITGVGCHFLL